MTEMRSMLGRVRGLGSAKEGVEHFWMQRLTAVGLIPLCLWFAYAVIYASSLTLPELKLWMADPFNLSMMILTICVGCHHGQMGVQVVIEDYVHTEAFKIGGLIIVKLLTVFLAMFCVACVLKIAFGG